MTRELPSRVRVFAPASVANLGPGFDVLGAALDGPGDVVVATRSRRRGVALDGVSGDGGRLPRDPALNTATVAAAAVLERARRKGGRVPGLVLSLEKGLPLASGLGSSAASAAAGAWAAGLLLGLPKRELLAAVLEAEHAADGSWHGDNAFAALLGGLLLVPSSDPRKLRLPIVLPVPETLRLVLVHPALELRTADSRAVLPRTVTLAASIRQGAALAELIAALHRGDVRAMGRAVSSDRIVEPARAPLVRGHREVVRALRGAGALGVALAGAGPSLLAIAEDDARAAAAGEAAVAAWRALGIEATARVHRVDAIGARALS